MKSAKRCLAGFLSLLLLSPFFEIYQASAKVREVKIRGYITNVLSATSFEIEDYRITRDNSVVFEFENEAAGSAFKPEDLRVGAEVEVRGLYNEETSELTAKKIKIDLAQYRSFKMTAILAKKPEGLEQTEGGWRGTFFPDGHRVRIEPSTIVSFKPNKSEEKALKEAKKKAGDKKSDSPDPDDAVDSADLTPLKSLEEVGPGTIMTYEGTEQQDGTVLATRVVFSRNELEKGELDLWKSLKVKEKPPNFIEGKPGELKIEKVGKFKLLPSQEIQNYVNQLGNSLIPAYQRSLPDADPQKIPFRFYVVLERDPNAFALPNGIVVVASGMFSVLENEAQLAAVISHEIAHATQEHTLRQFNKDRKKRVAIQIGILAAALFGAYMVQDILNLVLLAMVNGYQRTLENQADRVGLEYLVDAGYDPREAPRVWKLMTKRYGDAPTNFFWSNHDNNTSRRSYLMKEIRNNYSERDLTALRKGSEDEFARFAKLVAEASAKKKTIKVKV